MTVVCVCICVNSAYGGDVVWQTMQPQQPAINVDSPAHDTGLTRMATAIDHLAFSIGLIGSAMTDFVEVVRDRSTTTRRTDLSASGSAASQWSHPSVGDAVGDALTYLSL